MSSSLSHCVTCSVVQFSKWAVRAVFGTSFLEICSFLLAAIFVRPTQLECQVFLINRSQCYIDSLSWKTSLWSRHPSSPCCSLLCSSFLILCKFWFHTRFSVLHHRAHCASVLHVFCLHTDLRNRFR